jgi:hypothetical protein
MILQTNTSIDARVRQAVREASNKLAPSLRCWVKAHLVEPRPIELCTNQGTGTHAAFWLVTDHVGIDDAPLRIVFDGNQFGLEMTLEDGVSHLIHRASSFAEAVQCM